MPPWIRSTLALLLCWFAAASVLADSRTDFLVRMLFESSQFRVRAQAALALGGYPDDRSAHAALRKGLRDGHPAVRAASAAALERVADPAAVPALEIAARDENKAVREAARRALRAVAEAKSAAPSPRRASDAYYVGVGTPGDSVGLSKAVLNGLREHIAQELTQINGVRLAPSGESPKQAEKVLRADKLIGYFIDSSITGLQVRPDGSVRATVSVIVASYPGRDIRAMLSGAATVSGAGVGEGAKLEAARAALTGALRRLPQAMQAALARAL